MKSKSLFAAMLLAAVAVTSAIATLAIAESSQEAPAAGGVGHPLPPGWTLEDMQAMMAAGTPGKMQELLAKDAGVWRGKTTMWMYPGAEPMTSEGKSTITPFFEGRYVKCEMEGEMPGMGPYKGVGIYGYDNVAQQFVTTWIDNHSTGIAHGTGELSEDGKTITWNYTMNCPIAKKPVVLREVDTTTGANTKVMTMFGPDPKTGKEFKMMTIELTRE